MRSTVYSKKHLRQEALTEKSQGFRFPRTFQWRKQNKNY